MQFRDLIKEVGYEISFESISEPRVDGVTLSVIVNRSEDVTDLLIFPHPESKVTTFQIDFPNYITYSVVYDDYTVWKDDEIYEGESFRIYKKSNYLDYVKKSFRLDQHINHYSLACFEHHIDIISTDKPIVTDITL